MADRSTLRADVRDTISECASNLTDDTLNRMIRLATRKLERDMVSEARPNPRQMLAQLTGTTSSSGVLALPSDFLRARSVKIDDTVYKYASSERIKIQDSPADTEVNGSYYQRLTDLTDTTSNWLLDIADDLYIWATCLQYAPWNKDGEDLSVYGGLYTDALQTVCKSNALRPTGGMIQQKRVNYRSWYTIIGDSMYFGRAYGN